MTINYESLQEYFKSITECSENTLNFENSAISEDYCNNEVESAEKSNLHLKNYDILFITKYYDRIFEDAVKITFDEFEQMKYFRNPKSLSYDKFGTIDYWYLILLLNQWNSAYDMIDLGKTVLIPNVQTITNILTEEEFINSN